MPVPERGKLLDVVIHSLGKGIKAFDRDPPGLAGPFPDLNRARVAADLLHPGGVIAQDVLDLFGYQSLHGGGKDLAARIVLRDPQFAQIRRSLETAQAVGMDQDYRPVHACLDLVDRQHFRQNLDQFRGRKLGQVMIQLEIAVHGFTLLLICIRKEKPPLGLLSGGL